jgi:hypothetical protein
MVSPEATFTTAVALRVSIGSCHRAKSPRCRLQDSPQRHAAVGIDGGATFRIATVSRYCVVVTVLPPTAAVSPVSMEILMPSGMAPIFGYRRIRASDLLRFQCSFQLGAIDYRPCCEQGKFRPATAIADLVPFIKSLHSLMQIKLLLTTISKHLILICICVACPPLWPGQMVLLDYGLHNGDHHWELV